MDDKRSGGCLCGAVRYDVLGGATHETLCHCSSCRRASGAPVVAWFTVPPHAFRLTRGRMKSFRSSPGVVRSFCGDCGTPLTYRRESLDELDVTTCSLDDPEALPPRDHTYTRSALRWAPLDDGLPRHATLREQSPGDRREP